MTRPCLGRQITSLVGLVPLSFNGEGRRQGQFGTGVESPTRTEADAPKLHRVNEVWLTVGNFCCNMNTIYVIIECMLDLIVFLLLPC